MYPEWGRLRSSSQIVSLEPTGSIRGKDITWKVYPAGELGLAIDKGEIDAVANAEPIGSLLLRRVK